MPFIYIHRILKIYEKHFFTSAFADKSEKRHPQHRQHTVYLAYMCLKTVCKCSKTLFKIFHRVLSYCIYTLAYLINSIKQIQHLHIFDWYRLSHLFVGSRKCSELEDNKKVQHKIKYILGMTEISNAAKFSQMYNRHIKF